MLVKSVKMLNSAGVNPKVLMTFSKSAKEKKNTATFNAINEKFTIGKVLLGFSSFSGKNWAFLFMIETI